mgnify:CR=1 FL=1
MIDRRIASALALGVVTGIACADPNPSTLNQKCFADENCDDGQLCDKASGDDAGFCRSADDVVDGSTGTMVSMTEGIGTSGPSSGTDSTMPPDPTLSTGATDPATTSGVGDATDSGESDAGTETGTTGGELGCDGVPVPDVVSYAAVNTIAVGNNPQGAALGDLDGDGALDLAVSSRDDGTLRTFLGDGVGNLAPAETAPAGAFPGRVALGAIADATVDAVVEQDVAGTVNRMQGAGNGDFGNSQTVGDTLAAIELVDVDGDGVLDLLGANVGLTVSLGTPVAETFGAPIAFPTGLSGNGGEIATGDLDGNGTLDVVVAGGFNFAVMLGNGAGNFAAQAPRAVAGLASDVAIGDFDGNGDGDVVVVTYGGGTDAVRVFLGNGDGTFAPAPIVLGTQTSPFLVEVGDFDFDGDDDIFVGHASGGLGITVSNGDGSFAPQAVIDCDGNGNLRGLALGDLNGDCTLDVVSASSSGNVACVWLSN